jgi:hypothetical protein
MLGISPFAAFAGWHKLVSWVGYFEQDKWVDIFPEYDPFKFNSFPKEAGEQSYRLIKAINKKLDRFSQAERIGELPSILAFSSLVDATVSTEATIHKLFDRLRGDQDELVLFDVNHTIALEDFIVPKYDTSVLLAELNGRDALSYKLTVITNVEMGSAQISARTRLAGESNVAVEPLDERWPDQVYSLSHVAIPFPPDDPVYGDGHDRQDRSRVTIGMLHPRGEKKVLNIPPSLMLRLRYNPFFSYIEHRLIETIGSRRIGDADYRAQ